MSPKASVALEPVGSIGYFGDLSFASLFIDGETNSETRDCGREEVRDAGSSEGSLLVGAGRKVAAEGHLARHRRRPMDARHLMIVRRIGHPAWPVGAIVHLMKRYAG